MTHELVLPSVRFDELLHVGLSEWYHLGIIRGPSGDFVSTCLTFVDHPGIIRGPSGDHPGTFFRLCFRLFLTIQGSSGDHPGTIRGLFSDFFPTFFQFFLTFLRPSGDHPGTTRGSSGTPRGGGRGTPGPLTLIRTAGVMVSYPLWGGYGFFVIEKSLREPPRQCPHIQ